MVYVAPSDTWDEDRQRLDEIAVQARQTQYAEADADLIDLTLSHIARHRTHVDEVTSLDQLVQTQLGEQIAERAKEQQVDDATAYSESIDEFIAKFAADPAMIPEELHPLAQRLTDFYEDLPARHLEILAIQVRMQERYRNKSFELPKQ